MEPKITYNPSYDKLPQKVRSDIKMYLSDLAEQVERNAYYLLQSRYTQHPNVGSIKLNNWYFKCQEYFNSGEPPFDMYMTYGYAVEELTNLNYHSVSHPYSLAKQVSYNGSRCDYELGISQEHKYYVLAWIDITSADSEEHIWRKAAGRWHSAPCACEILYKPLDPEKLLSHLDGSIGQNIHALSQERRNKIEERKINNHLINCMHRVLKNIWDNICAISQTEVPNYFRQEFQIEMPDQCHIVCHGLLALFMRIAGSNDSYIDIANRVTYHYYRNHLYHSTALAERYLEQSYHQNPQEPFIYY